MQPIAFLRPSSIDDAIAAHHRGGEGARYVAGGTNLYDLMKLDIERPTTLIDLTAIDGLDRIDTDGDVLRFGANVRMSDLAVDPVIENDYPVLSQALSKAASQQLRNMATVGGNLLQRTRCLYFRNGYGGTSSGSAGYPCNKRVPGSGCAAIGGLDRSQSVLGASEACNAVSPGDWPVALVAMDAVVDIIGPNGRRALPVENLYSLPGTTPHIEFTLQPGEIIIGLAVPRTKAGIKSTYHKIRDRDSFAFALASAAIALDMTGDRVDAAHIALGGVATRPWRAAGAEAVLNGRNLTNQLALAAGQAAFSDARPGHSNSFKIELGVRTVADAILIAAGRAI
ncbi:FAD binding domain-containing protein [Rhizobium sp. YIM 134829]|uniref:FAD binding domain-containing protein n=1 Tax=Rhizobium sp. YIM 134829 TaxID=3390453 RepID=UPI00397D6485